MEDRACEHGYLHCKCCEDIATERARRVAEHYEREFSRPKPPYGGELNGDYPRWKRLDFSIPRPKPLTGRQARQRNVRCGCGSLLQAETAIESGQCHWCRTGNSPKDWGGRRCRCGSMLMSAKSEETGQCSGCRFDAQDRYRSA